MSTGRPTPTPEAAFTAFEQRARLGFVLREVFERRVQVLELALQYLAMPCHCGEKRVQLRRCVGRRFVQIEQIANLRQREAEPFAA
jgi:hypothetical protein